MITMNGNDQEQLSLLGVLLALSVTTIAILLFVVILQYRKIRSLNKIKVGFLAKPLLVAFAVFGGLGLYSAGFYLSEKSNEQGNSIDVSGSYSLEVEFLEINKSDNTYVFMVIPFISDVAWDNNDNFQISAYWVLTNSSDGIETAVEHGLTKNNTGGVEFTLQPGINTIKVTVYFGEDQFKVEKEVDVVIDG